MQGNRIIAIAFGALAACGTQSPPAEKAPAAPESASPGADAPAAKIGNEVITLGQVDAEVKGQLQKIRLESEKQVYSTRRTQLERMVVERILGDKAKAAGQTLDEYMKAEVEKQAKDPTDEEVAQFFQDNQARMGGQPLEQMKDRITLFLKGQKQEEVATKIIDDAKAAAKVEILLDEPLEPRVEVAAVGPSKGPDDALITIIEFSDFQ